MLEKTAAYADSGWGTCKKSRRSCSGGVIMLMGAYVYAWTRKQARVSLSLAEAELLNFYADDKASVRLHHTDSEAARCIALRVGSNPKVKHLGIRALHCQQVFEDSGRTCSLTQGCWDSKSSRPLHKARPGESENKNGPQAREAEVQWACREGGRSHFEQNFRDLKLRGRAACSGRSSHGKPDY
eukprot:1391304-Amphidinium_carterae.2